jgi:hypothetical protein
MQPAIPVLELFDGPSGLGALDASDHLGNVHPGRIPRDQSEH